LLDMTVAMAPTIDVSTVRGSGEERRGERRASWVRPCRYVTADAFWRWRALTL
jgi:hypothetical protein